MDEGKVIFISKFAQHRIYVKGKLLEFHRGILSLSDPVIIKNLREHPEFNTNITEANVQKAGERKAEEGPKVFSEGSKEKAKDDKKKPKPKK